jgi:hypothetical protein
MEIEFNTDRITEAQAGSPAARPSVTPAASAPVSFSATNSLLSQLSQLPTVRPEAVARARALVADESYPSDDVLNQVADRLATPSGSNANTPSAA